MRQVRGKGGEAGAAVNPVRDPEAAAAIVRRLSRIEGQVRALRTRVEADAYCVELAGDVAAIRAALDGVGGEIVARHVRTCLAANDPHPSAGAKSRDDLAAELGAVVARLL